MEYTSVSALRCLCWLVISRIEIWSGATVSTHMTLVIILVDFWAEPRVARFSSPQRRVYESRPPSLHFKVRHYRSCVWGRRGSPGTVRLRSYQRRNEAETAERRTIKRRLQHGFRLFQSVDYFLRAPGD